MELSERLYRLAKSVAGKQYEDLEKLFGDGKSRLEEALDEWEKRLNISWDEPEQENTSYQQNRTPYNHHTRRSKQYLEDLTTFGLVPPVAFEEIKKARNKEMKKYHADRFMHDAEKKKIAEEIMLIYNEAYERLKKHHSE